MPYERVYLGTAAYEVDMILIELLHLVVSCCVISVSPNLKKGHGKVPNKRALSARGDMQRGHL